MKTRTLRPAGTRCAGRAVRFPEKAARRSAESRGQGSLVPAPAGHMALREAQPLRPPPPAALLGLLPAARGSAKSTSAGGAAQSLSEPEAQPASSWRAGHPRRAAIRPPALRRPRLPLRGAASAGCRGSGGGRSAWRPRLRAHRRFAPGRASAGGRAGGHVPVRALHEKRGPPGGGDGGRGEQSKL